MKTMRLLLLSALLFAGAARADIWTDNYAKAVEQAKAEKKFLLLDFTGSDWCGWCIRLDKEVFSQKEFQSYAKENLVLVKLDFPRSFNLPGKTVKQNKELAQKFQIKGYPTIILLAPDEKLVGQTGYQPGGAEAYVQHLNTILDPARSSLGAASPSSGEKPKAGEMRTWTATSGDTIEASMVQRSGDVVHLRRADGKVLTIQAHSLSPADREFLDGPKK